MSARIFPINATVAQAFSEKRLEILERMAAEAKTPEDRKRLSTLAKVQASVVRRGAAALERERALQPGK